jgi:hypothetical protein
VIVLGGDFELFAHPVILYSLITSPDVGKFIVF